MRGSEVKELGMPEPGVLHIVVKGGSKKRVFELTATQLWQLKMLCDQWTRGHEGSRAATSAGYWD